MNIQEVYNKLLSLRVNIDLIQDATLTQLRKKIVECHSVIEAVEHFSIMCSKEISTASQLLNTQRAYYNQKKNHLLTDDPEIKHIQFYKDKEALADQRLKSDFDELAVYECKVADLENLYKAISVKMRNLTNLKQDIKILAKTVNSELEAFGKNPASYAGVGSSNTPTGTEALTEAMKEFAEPMFEEAEPTVEEVSDSFTESKTQDFIEENKNNQESPLIEIPETPTITQEVAPTSTIFDLGFTAETRTHNKDFDITSEKPEAKPSLDIEELRKTEPWLDTIVSFGEEEVQTKKKSSSKKDPVDPSNFFGSFSAVEDPTPEEGRVEEEKALDVSALFGFSSQQEEVATVLPEPVSVQEESSSTTQEEPELVQEEEDFFTTEMVMESTAEGKIEIPELDLNSIVNRVENNAGLLLSDKQTENQEGPDIIDNEDYLEKILNSL